MTENSASDAIFAILRGLAAAIVVTLVGMFILAALVVYAGLSDGALVALNQTLKIIAMAVGVLLAVRPGGRRGLALGACVGLIYIALGYGLCALSGTALVTAKMLALEMGMGLALGALCGVIVANLRPMRRKRA